MKKMKMKKRGIVGVIIEILVLLLFLPLSPSSASSQLGFVFFIATLGAFIIGLWMLAPTLAGTWIGVAVVVVVAGMAALTLTGGLGSSPTTTTTSPTTTTTTTSTTPTTTTPPGPENSRFGFENSIENWRYRQNITSITHCTTDSKYGSGCLQCTYENLGAVDGSIWMRPYREVWHITDKTLSVWVKFPSDAVGVGVRLHFMGYDWYWIDDKDGTYFITADDVNKWIHITWDLSDISLLYPDSVAAPAEVGLMVSADAFSTVGRGGVPWEGTFWVDSYNW